MVKFVCEEIPWITDADALLQTVSTLPHPVWLDSGAPHSTLGRWDIISADPEFTLRRKAGTFDGLPAAVVDHGNMLQTLNQLHNLFLQPDTPTDLSENEYAALPFTGGFIGSISYDFGRDIEKMPTETARDIDLPELWLGFYAWAVLRDHHRQRCLLVFHSSCPMNKRQQIHELLAELTPQKATDSFELQQPLQPEISSADYQTAIERVCQYIQAGDCYQVNYAQRFSGIYTGNPVDAYLKLRRALPSPFSAYLDVGTQQILSFSPERLLRVQGRDVLTQPIKGTTRRGSDVAEDMALATALSVSSKDRAENLMIVDLLRNDLSRSCSDVQVPRLFELQSFPNVHHLVSTVTGKLHASATPFDLLHGCFPGGSVTGAPKIRAMQIIEELEQTRRAIYCGSIVYFSNNGNMDSNIAIRTVLCDAGNIYCWGGSGIVADSEWETEYRETQVKVNVLLQALNNTLAS